MAEHLLPINFPTWDVLRNEGKLKILNEFGNKCQNMSQQVLKRFGADTKSLQKLCKTGLEIRSLCTTSISPARLSLRADEIDVKKVHKIKGYS